MPHTVYKFALKCGNIKTLFQAKTDSEKQMEGPVSEGPVILRSNERSMRDDLNRFCGNQSFSRKKFAANGRYRVR